MNSLEHESLNRGVELITRNLYRQRQARIILVGMYDAPLCTTTFRIRMKTGEIFDYEVETTMIRDRWKTLLVRIIREIDELDDKSL